jgi:hypothetical protein
MRELLFYKEIRMSDQDSQQVSNQDKQRLNERQQGLNLAYFGMIGLALVVMQAFIGAGISDVASFISVLALALVLPIMAVCLYIMNEPVLAAGKASNFLRTIVNLVEPQ